MIKRYYDEKMEKYLKPGKVFLVYGPRRVGKTTLRVSPKINWYFRCELYPYIFALSFGLDLITLTEKNLSNSELLRKFFDRNVVKYGLKMRGENANLFLG